MGRKPLIKMMPQFLQFHQNISNRLKTKLKGILRLRKEMIMVWTLTKDSCWPILRRTTMLFLSTGKGITLPIMLIPTLWPNWRNWKGTGHKDTSRSMSRATRDKSGVRDPETRQKLDTMKKKMQQKKFGLWGKAGESDRKIPTKMPKHLFA